MHHYCACFSKFWTFLSLLISEFSLLKLPKLTRGHAHTWLLVQYELNWQKSDDIFAFWRSIKRTKDFNWRKHLANELFTVNFRVLRLSTAFTPIKSKMKKQFLMHASMLWKPKSNEFFFWNNIFRVTWKVKISLMSSSVKSYESLPVWQNF